MSKSEPLAPQVFHVTITDADTEYSQALPVGTKFFQFSAQGAVVLRYAWVTGKVATPTAPYGSLKANTEFRSPEKLSLSGDSRTLYLACASGSQTAEIVAWVAETT